MVSRAVLLRLAAGPAGLVRGSVRGDADGSEGPRLGRRSRLHPRPLRRWLRAARWAALHLLLALGLFQPLLCAIHCWLPPASAQHRHGAALHAQHGGDAEASDGAPRPGCHTLADGGLPSWAGGRHAPGYDALPLAAIALIAGAARWAAATQPRHGPPRRISTPLLRPPKRSADRPARCRQEIVEASRGTSWCVSVNCA